MIKKDIDGYYIINKPEDLDYINGANPIKYECKICGKVVKHKNDFRKHRIAHFKRMMCDTCMRKEYNNRPDVKARMIATTHTVEARTKQSESLKIMWANKSQEEKDALFNKIKEKWANKTEEEQQILNERTQKTKKEKYGDPYFTNRPKAEQTFKEKHNGMTLQTYIASEECQNKVKATSQEKYGTDYPCQSQIVKDKITESTIKSLGVKRPIQNIRVKEKIENKFIETLGAKSPLCGGTITREKGFKTREEKYGDPYYSNHEKAKQTMLEEYGRTGGFSLTYSYYGVTFDSSWELAVWIYYMDHNIGIIRLPCYFEYKDTKNKIHNYYPDFWIDGIGYVEIKGDHFIKDDGTFVDVFDNKDINYDCKRICANEHNVQIWTENDCKKYLNYCRNKFDDSRWHRIFKANNPNNPSYINPNGFFKVSYPLIKMIIYYSPLNINNWVTSFSKIDNDGYVINNNSRGITPFDIGK